MPTFASQARPNLTNLVKNRDRRNSVKTSFNDARKTVGAIPKLKKTEISKLTATTSASATTSGQNSTQSGLNDARKTMGGIPKRKKTETSESAATASAPAGASGLARQGPKIVIPVKLPRPQSVVRPFTAEVCVIIFIILCVLNLVFTINRIRDGSIPKFQPIPILEFLFQPIPILELKKKIIVGSVRNLYFK